MKTIIFCGPSITLDAAIKIYPEGIYYPPVECGSILKCLKEKPERIAIIDGYFQRVPAVWHKEIMFALSIGVEVYGSSSMGALRAAELYQYGMIGVGEVFKQFQSGFLEDDDEVAVLHHGSRKSYAAISHAMVNIRQTLFNAEKNEIITKYEKKVLLNLFKKTHYAKRDLFILTSSIKMNIEKKIFLNHWVKNNYTDQKKLDSEELLLLLKNNQPLKSTADTFMFQKTSFLEQLASEICCGILTT